MKNTSALTCEHIRVHCVPGRTDAYVRALQDYITSLFALSDEFGSAEIRIQNDDHSYRFEWLDKEIPESNCGAIDEMSGAREIDVRIDMCCDLFIMDDAQRALAKLVRDGSLKDCVHYCLLMEDEYTSSLSMSGLYRGSFLHGAVPFTFGDEDILIASVWNGYTHRAEFSFPSGDSKAIAAATEVADALEEKLSEISISRAPSDDKLYFHIDSPQLSDLDAIQFYRASLEKLVQAADSAQIVGAFTPENDDVFALLRFVQAGNQVIIETAVAEPS